MGKSEIMMLVAVLGGCFILLVCMMVALIKRHGSGIRKGRKKPATKDLGYNPAQVSGAAAACAIGSLICGLLVAMTPFTRK